MFDTMLIKLTEASLSPNVIATLIGAIATLLAALIQLRVSWRREQVQLARPRKGQPEQRRLSRLLWLIVLILAAAVGGFAGVRFLTGGGLGDVEDRTELRQRIAQLGATAERIEKAGAVSSGSVIANAHAGSATMALVSTGSSPVVRESSATITVAPCRLRAGDAAAAAAGVCAEADALRVAVCAAIPANVKVPAVTAFLRADDSTASWTDSRALLGQELVLARFAEQVHERTDADGQRQMCLNFWSWHPDRTYTARLQVEAASHEAHAAR